MASVTSLDQDMKKLRLDRYTPGAAKEIRAWIEDVLGQTLPPGDLMDALKDGVALCRLAILAGAPGVKYKESSMPFVQMENISHFLRACEMPPLNLPSHDRFLTVDLYDGKDPAQVIQCIAAFSRAANAVSPTRFPSTLGAKSKGATMSPQGTGGSTPSRSPAYTTTAASTRPRGFSNAPESPPPSLTFNPLNKAAYSGKVSPSKNTLARGGLASGGAVSTWSTRNDQSSTAPAWNIHQYGYMGGASQGNQGVAFGARRQITSPAPSVPSLAEKEKLRREQEDKQRREAEERERAEAERQAQRDEEERLARIEEERRWEEETRRQREKEEAEKQRLEEKERVRRAEQQRQQRAYEREREREAQDLADREAAMEAERNRQRASNDDRLNGQFLSQYRATDQARTSVPASPIKPQQTSEAKRIAELERQLEEMKRQQREAAARPVPEPLAPVPALAPRPLQTSHEDDWSASERDYLKQEWAKNQESPASDRLPLTPARSDAPTSPRPLPDPATYVANASRTDRFLASNPAPTAQQPASHRPDDYSTTTEVDLENQRRLAAQTKTKAGGWASKSLLEREKERERERQREWEEGQKVTAAAARDNREGSNPGQTWDVHQYGYMGGDSQNRGGQGIGASRRQIIGPRPPP